MASGKKGKKTKGKTLALTDFLQEPTGSQPVRKSNINWADEVEDYDGYDSRKPVNVVLPTAPKASRDFDDISDNVPKDPPYIAYLSNLPYDVDEDEIAQFFKNLRVANMRIPKDDRSSDMPKSKGFGYVEFDDRDSLLGALTIPDTMLKGRRIRIEVAANSDSDRRRNRMDMNRDNRDRSETSGDWRSGPRADSSADSDRRGGGGFGRDRDGGGFTRDNMRGGDREDRSFSRDNMRGGDRNGGGFNREDNRGGFGRDRDRDGFKSRDRDGADDRPGGWREGGDRAPRDQDNRGFSRGSSRFDDRDNRDDRNDRRGGYGSRRFDSDRERNGGFSRDRDSEASSEPRERPKLVLAPRSKPVENESVKTESVPSMSIFGSAKPVDTSQREREIEAKLAREQQSDKHRDGSPERKEREDKRDASEEKKVSDQGEDGKNIERSSRPPRRMDDSKSNLDEEKGGPPSKNEDRSPEKQENKNKIDKSKRDEKREKNEKEKEMPKFSDPEPPNFAANNKFAFLDTEDNSD